MKFSDFNLHEDLLKGIDKIGFADCMEVQEATLQHTLAQKDVYVQSQTGSGKTAAFLVSIFELFRRNKIEKKRALIIVPTRELAVQIEREAKTIGSFLPFRIGSVYGGVGYAEQLTMLKEGYEVIIGTPGRLIDLEQSRKLNLKDTSVLVIDEADRLFDMGFLPDIRRMLRKMPDRSHRMTMLFSATLNTRVWQVAWEYMNDPLEILMNPEQLTVDEITQELYHVSRTEKTGLLLGILEKENPENVLIFCNTKSGAYDLAQRLTHNGYPCRYIIGDLPQKKRIKVIDQLKSGELKYLVATDVAARGLHVDDLSLVVNYDLPEDPENYVHRIGRTARAGNTGKAISLACERFVYGLEPIQELIDMKIPVAWVEDNMVVADKSANMHFNRHRDLDHAGGVSRDSDSRGSRGARRPSGERHGGRPHSAGPGRSRTASRPAGNRETGARPEGGRDPARRADGARPVRSGGGASNQNRQSDAPKRPTAARNEGPRNATGGNRPRQGDGRQRGPQSVKRDMSVEDRLVYYREKYGEDFEVGQSTGKENAKSEQKSGKVDSGNERSGKEESVNKEPKKGLLKGLFRKSRR